MRFVWIALSVLIGAFLVLCAAIALGDIFGAREESLGTNIGLILFFGVCAAGSFAVAWSQYRRGREERPSRQALLDQRLLQIAAAGDGCLTVAEVSLKAGLTLEESKTALSRLARTGVAEPELRDDGELVYRVRGVLESGR